MNLSKSLLVFFLALCSFQAIAQKDAPLIEDVYKDNISTVQCYSGHSPSDYGDFSTYASYPLQSTLDINNDLYHDNDINKDNYPFNDFFVDERGATIFFNYPIVLLNPNEQEMPEELLEDLQEGLPEDQKENYYKINLSFDDLDGDTKDYYYTLIHCNSDWTPSGLNSLEYIDGFDTERILDYEFSFNTLVEYTHYRLALPNDDMTFTKSGNYILKVFEDEDEDNVILTRRFMVVDPQVKVQSQIVAPYNSSKKRSHHEIDFIVNHFGFNIRAPRDEVKVVVMQNGRWDNAITDIKPVFVKGTELVYKFQDKVIFPAGIESRYVDLSSTRIRGDFVQSLDNDANNYYMTVMPGRKPERINYRFARDIGGRYIVSNEHERNNNLESDYITTFFKFEPEIEYSNGSLYLFGALTDWKIKDEFEMSYVPAEKAYLLKTWLKQGLYNFNYVFVEDGNGRIDQSMTGGNWHETENDYHILVYYRPFGERYDQLINVTYTKSHW